MSDSVIRVAVVGAAGRMGMETVKALSADPAFELVSVVGRKDAGRSIREFVPSAPDLLIEDKFAAAMDRAQPQVVVNYAHYASAHDHASKAMARGINFVFGMTGISDADVRAIRSECRDTGVSGMIVPNFAIGAVLMMKFAEMAAKWIPDCEIVEMHHDRKEDAPSGTAFATAQRIEKARTMETTRLPRSTIKVEGVRGGNVGGVPVHSVRLPGLLAHQMVMFGSQGDLLTLRHDSLDRAGFMDGVKLCVQRVGQLEGLTVGMDKILFES